MTAKPTDTERLIGLTRALRVLAEACRDRGSELDRARREALKAVAKFGAMTYEQASEALKGVTVGDLRAMLGGGTSEERLEEVNEACAVLVDHYDRDKRKSGTAA